MMLTIPASVTEALTVEESGNLWETAEAAVDTTRTYRYALSRTWSAGPVAVFVMLNPSTADAASDDPTLRRCIGFARAHGYGGIVVVNLFALRATDPAALASHPDPIGPSNDAFIGHCVRAAPTVIAAWGAHPTRRVRQRADTVARRLLRTPAGLSCLGLTHSGQPRHPLYLNKNSRLRPFHPPHTDHKGQRICD